VCCSGGRPSLSRTGRSGVEGNCECAAVGVRTHEEVLGEELADIGGDCVCVCVCVSSTPPL